MSISSEITRINTNIANSYTAVDNKNGTLPQVQNSANLASAIDSIEVIESAIAEGESLSLTNTKAMPYNDFVIEGKSEQEGEPSPSNPSEIHSVADDVNLWNGNILSLNNATYSNGIVTQTTADTASNIVWKFNALNNSSFVRQLDTQIKNNTGILDFTFIKDNTFNVLLFGLNGSTRDTTIRISLADLIDDETYTLSFNVTNVTQGSISWQDIKIQKGTTATPYSPYNQGTVTIKQRGTTENNDYTIQTEPLRSLPNGVKDTIEADGIHRRVGRIVLDGTDNWSFATEGDNTNGKTFYSNRKSDMKSLTYQEVISLDDIFVISDTFKGYAFKELNKTPRKLNFISLGISTLLINISNETGVKTVEEFKTYLNNNPIVVQYQLNEEVIEPLTQNQATTMLDIIKTGSYEGTTNIYTDEDVKPTIGVGYYKKG